MIRATLIVVAALTLAESTLAERAGANEHLADASNHAGAAPHCILLAKARKDLSDYKFTPLTPGQFHFAEGVYVGLPMTPPGLPPGDSAMLAQRDGDKDGVIIWTRGSLACAPVPVNEALIKLISAIKTGALDSDGSEL